MPGADPARWEWELERAQQAGERLGELERQEAQEHPAGAGPGWALAVEQVRLAGERLAAQQDQVAEAVRQAAERLGQELSRQAAGWYPGVAALAAQVEADQGHWALLAREVAALGEGQRQVVANQVDREHLAELARALPSHPVELGRPVAPLDQLADRVQRLAGAVADLGEETRQAEDRDPAGLARSGLAGVLVPRGAAHPGDFPVASHPAGESHLPLAERQAGAGPASSLDQAVADLVALRQEEEAQREVRPVAPDPLPAGLVRHHLAGLMVVDPRALIQGLPSGL